MGKWCLHASLFIFDPIIIKVAGNQDRHKSLVKFDFGPNQITHFGVTCPWVTKISHFRTWISLKPVGQSWSNFMCSIIRVGERLHKVLGQIDLAHWTQVSDRCPLGYLFFSNTSCLNFETWMVFPVPVMNDGPVWYSSGVDMEVGGSPTPASLSAYHHFPHPCPPSPPPPSPPIPSPQNISPSLSKKPGHLIILPFISVDGSFSTRTPKL